MPEDLIDGMSTLVHLMAYQVPVENGPDTPEFTANYGPVMALGMYAFAFWILCVKMFFYISRTILRRFYPRPLLASGYCRYLLRHQVFPRDNSSPVQARITKFGVKDLGLDPYCFVGWLTLTFKVKFNVRVKIYPILSLSAQ